VFFKRTFEFKRKCLGFILFCFFLRFSRSPSFLIDSAWLRKTGKGVKGKKESDGERVRERS
jgi:hypothetical protein